MVREPGVERALAAGERRAGRPRGQAARKRGIRRRRPVLKHIIFDCDGVLWEGTNEGYVRCYHRAAVEVGIELDYGVARERIVANWGRSAQHEIEGMIPEHPECVGEVVRRYRRLVRSDLFLERRGPDPRRARDPAIAPAALSALGDHGDERRQPRHAAVRFKLRGYLRHALSTGDSDDPARQKHTGYHLRQLLEWEARRRTKCCAWVTPRSTCKWRSGSGCRWWLCSAATSTSGRRANSARAPYSAQWPSCRTGSSGHIRESSERKAGLSRRCDGRNRRRPRLADGLRPLRDRFPLFHNRTNRAKRPAALTEERLLATLAFLQFHKSPPCGRRHHTSLRNDEKPRGWGEPKFFRGPPAERHFRPFPVRFGGARPGSGIGGPLHGITLVPAHSARRESDSAAKPRPPRPRNSPATTRES